MTILIGPKTLLTYQKFKEVDDGVGGKSVSWFNVSTYNGVLSPQSGNRTILRDGIGIQVTHRFYFGKPQVDAPLERNRFQTQDKVHTFEILWIQRPLNHWGLLIADLIEIEKPAAE